MRTARLPGSGAGRQPRGAHTAPRSDEPAQHVAAGWAADHGAGQGIASPFIQVHGVSSAFTGFGACESFAE
jgi:hypothetical protein